MQEITKRKVDELGRVILPVEVRRDLGIDEKDELSIFVNEGKIILKKSQPSCLMCKNTDNLTIVDDKSFCMDCISKIKKMV